jgi:AbrB family looped-hinge helix DNA binding protein
MQSRLSSKGQIVLPAPMRRLLGLKPKSKVLIEERDGGIFIRPVPRKQGIAPIAYLPEGAIKLSERDYALDMAAGEDDMPAREL